MKSRVRFISIIVIVVAAAGYFYFSRGDSTIAGPGTGSRTPGAADRSTIVNAVVLTSAPFAERISTTGTILADEEVDLRSETAGRVIQINFNEGTRVTKGQLLVKTNDADLQAQLKKVESQVKIATDNEERQRLLLEKNLTAREQYDLAVNQLNSVRAESMAVRANLAKTEVRAPFDGVIGLRYVSEGSYVTTSSRIASLLRLSTIKVDFSVPERFAAFVKPGAQVMLRVQGTRDQVPAFVYAIEPKIDPSTRTVQVRARAENPGERLKAGAFAEIALTVSIDPNALLVPTEAIVPVLKGQQVFRYQDGKAQSIDVEIGTRTERNVIVTKGLAAGDTVIVSGILQISNGSRVRLNNVN